jgi:hypothetical protein
MPDLILCEARGIDRALCAAIRDVRMGASGDNPFVVIIVTSWDRSTALVSEVLNSGADDLLLRPFSATVLAGRIRTHVEARKAFVIGTGYLGPDRRLDQERARPVRSFLPPNSLRMRVLERLSPEAVSIRLTQDINQARALIATETLRRDVLQICTLWRRLQDETVPADVRSDDFSALEQVARSVATAPGSGVQDRNAVWRGAILAAVEALRASPREPRLMQLLGHAALNLAGALSAEGFPALSIPGHEAAWQQSA